MVYEVIGKVAIYIIGTLLLGTFTSWLDDTGDNGSLFFGAWFAGLLVFLGLILP